MADRNENKEVSVSELMVHLSVKVPQETDPFPQNPIVSGQMQTILAVVDEVQDVDHVLEDVLESGNAAILP